MNMAFASLADELDLDGPGYDYEEEYDRGVGVSLADELLDGPDDLGIGMDRGECGGPRLQAVEDVKHPELSMLQCALRRAARE